MSFAVAFYNFTIELNHTDRDVYIRFRVKTPHHPLESLQHLFARTIAYAHCFREGQTFPHGLFEPKEPTIWHKDILGETLLWVQLGVPDKKKLEVTLRASLQAEHRIYFYEENQSMQFCHMLRGSKTNWVKDVQFFQISPKLLEELVPLERSSPIWNVTFVDNQLYLNCDGAELQSAMIPLSIWDVYQESLLHLEGESPAA